MSWFEGLDIADLNQEVDAVVGSIDIDAAEEELKKGIGNDYGPPKMPEGFHEGAEIIEAAFMKDKEGNPFTKYNEPNFHKLRIVWGKDLPKKDRQGNPLPASLHIQKQTLMVPVGKNVKDKNGKINDFKNLSRFLTTVLNADGLTFKQTAFLIKAIISAPEMLIGLKANIKVEFPGYPNAHKYVRTSEGAFQLLEFQPEIKEDLMNDIEGQPAGWVETDLFSEGFDGLQKMIDEINVEEGLEGKDKKRIVHKEVRNTAPSALNELSEDHQKLMDMVTGNSAPVPKVEKASASQPIEASVEEDTPKIKPKASTRLKL